MSWKIITYAIALAAMALPPALLAAAPPGFAEEIAPFFKQHCVKCHGAEKPKADFALHAIDADLANGSDIESWKQIAERLALGEMPPESEPRPEARRAAAVLAWIKVELTKAGEDVSQIGAKLLLPGHGNRVDHEALFSAKPDAPAASPPRLWRLRPQIYVSFVPRINKNAKVGQPFSSHSGEGFKDYADLFVVDEPTISQLLRNAEAIVELQLKAKIKEFEPLIAADREPTSDEVRAALRRQFQAAVLRDPTEDELARFAALLEKTTRDSGRPVAARTTLAAVLMLPETMYRFELGQGQPDAQGRVMLAPRELAHAIAFALTDEAPDAALAKAAASGKLASRDDVRREVERILADAKLKKPRIMGFFDEYFEYPAAADVFKDLPRGEWRPEVLIHDTRLLIQHILDADRDVLKELLTTNKSFVNAKVDPRTGQLAEARPLKPKEPKVDKKTGKVEPVPPRDPSKDPAFQDYYNLPVDWKWTAEQPIELPANERAGILTQPSWLAAFATNNENHAIRRGKWVRERLLGGVVPDLPIAVDAKLPDTPDKPLRERMEITREQYCWQCHQKMNPLGLTFENFDYLGRFRTTEGVVDIAATAKLPKGKGGYLPVLTPVPLDTSGVIAGSGEAKLDGPVQGSIEFVKKLADSPRVRQVFVRHAFRFFLGRNETLADGPTLVAADEAYVKSGGSMKALIASLLSSDAFVYRAATPVSKPPASP